MAVCDTSMRLAEWGDACPCVTECRGRGGRGVKRVGVVDKERKGHSWYWYGQIGEIKRTTEIGLDHNAPYPVLL